MQAAQLNERPDFPLMKLGDAVSFFHMQMPRWLFCGEKYRPLSLEAKVAYTFLLNRFQLSRLNGWVNGENEVFVIFTRESLAEEMGVSVRKAIACFKELSAAGLIWERRLGRGYPNQIYLAAAQLSGKEAAGHKAAPFIPRSAESAGLKDAGSAGQLEDAEDTDMQNPQVLNCQNGNSKAAEPAAQELPVLQANKKEKEYTKLSENEKSPSDGAERAKLNGLLSSCGLWSLPLEEAGVFRNAIERLWYADRFTVDGVILPREKLRRDLLRLDADILLDTCRKLRQNTTQVRNSTAYIMAALLNNIWEYESDVMLDPELNRREPL